MPAGSPETSNCTPPQKQLPLWIFSLPMLHAPVISNQFRCSAFYRAAAAHSKRRLARHRASFAEAATSSAAPRRRTQRSNERNWRSNFAWRQGVFGRCLRVGCKARHTADQLRGDLRCAPGFGRNEYQHLFYAYAQFAMVGRFDAHFAGSAARLHGPKIERQAISKTRRLGKINREMHGGSQDLFVME